MATINADVEIDIEDHLNEVDTNDLIAELRKRIGGESEVIAKALTDNLADEMKMEEFLEVFKNIRQAELTDFLNQYK